MNAERWQQVDRLLDKAVELPPAQRAAFLDRECGGDAELRAQVESLVRAHQQAEGFLNEPAFKVIARRIATLDPEQATTQAPHFPTGDARIGTVVSHYKIIERLGKGGMGVVYKAEDTRLGRFVALKFLSELYARDLEALERFQREARIVAALDHPNICTVYDIGEHEGQPFIVMQLLEGRTLSDYASGKPLEIGEAIELALEIASGLEKAHQTGVIHRDLKPGNIFITNDGHVKILDFGLAKLNETADAALLTQPGVAVGTVAYMSPEQARGQSLDPRTDLFSFGAVLYEMITGHRAFGGPTHALVFDAVLHEAPAPSMQLNAKVSPRLAEIAAKALEKEREARYQSAGDLREDLKRFQKESESFQVSLSSPRRRGSTWRWLWAASIGIVIAAGGLSALMMRRNDSTVPAPVSSDPRLTLFLSSPQRISDFSLSPDGKTVVYVAVDQDQSDIFVSRTAGGGRIRVTNDNATELRPRFSPDGETILFHRLVPGKDMQEICRTPVFGGETVSIVAGGVDPSWSPDGSRIAFVGKKPGGPAVLTIADINGANRRDIVEADATYPFIYNPTWSPDGLQLAFIRSMGGITGEVWIVSSTGGPSRRVWEDPTEVFSHNPVFNPEGEGIVHSSNRGGATNLWLMPLNGLPPVRLTTGSGPDENPDVARNGTIAFSNSRYRDALVIYDLARRTLRELLAHLTFVHWGPAFSPAGDEVAFSRLDAGGSWHIWTVPVSGDAPRQLTFGPLPETSPRYTPDGQSIIFSTWSAQPDQIWRIPREGGAASPITRLREEDDAYGDISPDQRWLAFARIDKGVTRVHVVSIEGGEPKPLTRSPSAVPRWSPDGRWIAFSRDRSFTSGVFVVNADGSDERRLTETGGWPVWWPDGKRIAYVSVKPDGNQEIQTVDLNSGAISSLSEITFNGTNFTFDVSTNGQLVTTNSIHLATEIWMMEPNRY